MEETAAMAESCERLKRDLSKAERKTSNWARDMVNRIDTTLQATEKLLELADEGNLCRRGLYFSLFFLSKIDLKWWCKVIHITHV